MTQRRPAAVRWARKAWTWTWPKALAIAIVIGLWQFLFWTEWRPPFVLPVAVHGVLDVGRPRDDEPVLGQRLHDAAASRRRLSHGFGHRQLSSVSLCRGCALLRLAIGSLITGLQTMPSIAWFPFAIVVFGGTENAIYFVVVLGAAPSIANGIISGIDHVPPSYVRLGKVMGANSFSLYRHVVLPAALPSYVAGLSQGWAFAWRSLMAGELLVLALGVTSVGASLDFARQLNHMDEVIAWMIVILVIGMVADTIFTSMSRTIRRRRGLAIDD